ncbi:YjbE family integral membrane protein [Bradyrhizobium sp. AZCC 1610]
MLHFISNEVMALLQVVMIDLVLAGDNAIVIGLAAAGLPLQQRTKAVLVGIVAATVLRITFAAATSQLLQVVGLVLAGGVLLLWVSWKMFRELRLSAEGQDDAIEAMSNMDINDDGTIVTHAPRKSFAQAASQIIVADVSMSLDNVLAYCRSRARASFCSDYWAWLISCSDGDSGGLYRSPIAQAPVDRICGIACNPVCRRRYDLARDERGLAADRAIMIADGYQPGLAAFA